MSRIHHFSWVEKFIDGYLAKVKGNGDLIEKYNKGVLFFYKKEYEKSKKLLYDAQMMTRDTFYILDARVYFLRILLEEKDEEVLKHGLESFRKYVTRSSISKGSQKNYLSFHKYLKRLTGILFSDSENKSTRFQTLENLVQEDTNVANKAWLLSRIKQAIDDEK